MLRAGKANWWADEAVSRADKAISGADEAVIVDDAKLVFGSGLTASPFVVKRRLA